MKCPKCSYLGFETGDRCRNCGYDFSLIAAASREANANADLRLRGPETLPPQPPAWPDHVDRALAGASPREGERAPAPRALRAAPAREPQRGARPGDAALPLFGRASIDDDEPLIKVPAAPRPPLAVRRTPDAPARRIPKDPPQPRPSREPQEEEPTLRFAETPRHEDADRAAAQPDRPRTIPVTALEPGGAVRRLAAAAIDHAILLAIDITVIYFTLRLASLGWSDWRLLPPLPLLAFLGLIKLAYFSAFTALGGQTIGKMAARIRVVADDNRFVDPACAIRRSLAGAVSLLTLGAGFVPALVSADRRALHDRLAHTRVVTLPSA